MKKVKTNHNQLRTALLALTMPVLFAIGLAYADNPYVSYYGSGTIFDDSNVVNFEHFAALAEDWQKGPGQYVGDISGPNGIPDGYVDNYDLAAFCENWLKYISAPLPLSGDLNGDYKVDFEDFVILAEDWQKGSGQYVGDISGPNGIPDGYVDNYDLAAFCEDWLKYVSPLPTCIISCKMNDNDVNSTILTNSMGPITVDTNGICNPVFNYSTEASIFKVDDTHYIGWLEQDNGKTVHYMTSQDGLVWDVCSIALNLNPPITTFAEFEFVVKSDPNYYLFVHNTSDGKEYCYDVTNPTAPLLMNNGRALLTPSTNGWDTSIYNVGVTMDANGNWYMVYEAHAAGTAYQIGFAYVTPQHNPPTTTDNLTFVKSTNNAPFVVGQCPYLAYVPGRNALLAIIGTTDNNNALQLQTFTASLASDLNQASSWNKGAVIVNNGGTNAPADAHLITNYSSSRPILMIWDNQIKTYEGYIDLTLDQLYDNYSYKTPTMYGASSTTGLRTTTGKIGSAINFNGINNYAQFGTYNAGYVWDTTPILDWNNVDWSVSFWAKQNAQGVTQDMVECRVGPVAANYWDIGVSWSGYVYLKYTGNNIVYPNPLCTIQTAVWKHYVLTVSRANRQAALWVDANQVLQTSISGYNIGDTTNLLRLGGSSQSQYWNGAIDSFMVFSGVLTPGNVAYLYNDGQGRELP